MLVSAHQYNQLTTDVIHVKIMIMYSAFYTAVETSALKHEGIRFVLAETQAQNASEQLDGDVTYGSLKSY